MQDPRRESGVDADYQQDRGVHGGTNHNNDVNTFDNNYHVDENAHRASHRRNPRGGYRGRDARGSANWRENDEPYAGSRQADAQKYRGPFPPAHAGDGGNRDQHQHQHQEREGEREGEGERERERGRGRGGRGRGERGGRGGRGRGERSGRGSHLPFHHDPDATHPAEEALERYPADPARSNEDAPGGGGNDFVESDRPRGPRRDDRGEYGGYSRGARQGGRGYRGGQGQPQNRQGRPTDDYDDGRDYRPRGGGVSNASNNNNWRQDSHEKAKGLESYGEAAGNFRENVEQEESAVVGVLPPGFKRRTQRASHLRRNCHDETEILELFEHHHRQKGISLENYDNIPVVIVPRDIMAVEDFSDLKVEPALMANIERCGYKKPTPVQRYGIPVAIAGNDLMACAQTGSGKTAAFLVPIVQYILVKGVSPAKQGICYPIALIMAPTRELALQIYDEVRKLTFRTDVFYDVVYGGTPYPTRFENDILVACPGRVKDIFDRGSLSFQAIKFLVLDEADRMLEMGFEEQIEYLVASRYTDMPKVDERQTLMFSATFPTRILNLARRYLRKQYYLLTIGRVGSTTKNITQVIEKVQETEKMDRLFELIYAHKRSDLVLIFVETKKSADDLHRELKKEHIPSSTIHGDRRQQDRERSLAEFKSGETPILVATDVASRGLDIPNVAHVIQYDLPSEMDDYVHRIGRTGRAGNKGTATCFYNRNNRKVCLELYKYLQEHEQDIPTWFKEEAELVEGDAMLSRDFGMNRRRGGGGGGGGYTHSETVRARDTDESWGTSAAASGRGRGRGKAGSGVGNAGAGRRSNLTTDIDDGGF